MVALMRFTKDICWLLGFGNESPGESQRPEESQEKEGPSPEKNEEVTLSQDVLSGEEGLSEEERARRRAERRRARRKRQRERKKQDKEKKSERREQDREDVEEEEEGEEGEGAESELGDSESEEEEENGPERVEEEQRTPRTKDRLIPPLASSGNRGNRQTPPVSCEEAPEWDVSCAFVAKAASHIRPKSRTRSGGPRSGPRSKENKENESRTRGVNSTESVSKRSTSLTEKGIKLVQQGKYSQAASMFTEAIKYNPTDYRFFGNRSYCYECLEQYPLALADAERSIQLAPEWPKGYFRKGSALIGMKRYSEAEKAMELVLQLDKDCEEAVTEVLNCRVLQLMELGFEETQSVLLLERYSTVQAVLSSPEAAKVMNQDSIQDQAGPPCCSLWVGNVTAELTEKHLWDLFKTFGEIDSIRVLHERFCAFVNFRNANMAARALEKLHGVELVNTRLVIRYPERRTQRVSAPSALPQVTAARAWRRGPVQGGECYFWRTTGCHFGEKCRYKHIPEQRGRDRQPWQP
ncbi:hsp70-Hsp90 organizing protein 1-like [Anguilla anguilla]|uniref:hsp70-Hsp90 organizing protein 1-like n=1 Tax=Anguilla anguilla TaxID=7936 RepID=UPI0015B00988|nr:hsp70-Hsp90 organizing protein 1-like [Anguilla anguilla]